MFDFLSRHQRKHSCVDVVGYLSSQSGVGQAGRLLIDALNANGCPVTTFDVKREFGDHFAWPMNPKRLKSKKMVMAIDAHTFRFTHKEISRVSKRKKYLIAQWFWELEKVPEYFLDAMRLIDELWVPTHFMYEAFLAVAPHNVSISHMPLPLKSNLGASFNRDYFSIGNNFMFLYIFDFLSVMKRKNPIAVVEAFCRAFKENEGPILVIKTENGELRPNEAKQLIAKIGQRNDVKLIGNSMTRDELTSLISACDAYVSLHRSEGLGLTLAEAMSMGKPVIATGYSGNLDFMNQENSILIPWTRVKVGNGAEGYDSEATWAEPNIEACAIEMKRLVSSPQLCLKLGRQATRTIDENYSNEITGLKMVRRLEVL